jgi:type II secretion system protein D
MGTDARTFDLKCYTLESMHYHGRLIAVILCSLYVSGSAVLAQNEFHAIADRPTTIFVSIAADRMPSTQRELAAVFRNQLSLPMPTDRSVWELVVGRDANQTLRLKFDSVRSGVHVTGSPRLSRQFAKLVATLTAAPQPGYRTQVFRLDRKNHDSLRGAVNSIGNDKPQPLGAANPIDQSRYTAPAGAFGSVQQAAFQNPIDPEDNANAPADRPGNEARPADEAQPDGTPQFDGVEIESLPDLDVIILRGRDPDLAQLADVVEELERISKETQANIRVLPLKHVSSEAIAEVITEVSPDLVGGRQGRVSVTPLVKPNALLLIGWGDAVKAVIQLAKQLDTPVAPDSQSAIFRLKHAQAIAVGAAIEEFLRGRTGLGPKAIVTIDPRTNALIVFASPRDLQEVERLIDDLDQPGGEAIHRTRVFEIRNALAADIADTLESALSDQVGRLAIEVVGPDGRRMIQSGSLDQIRITPNVRNNTLIVTSPIENMELIEELLDQLDSPSGQAQLKIFQIVNGDAASMIQMLRSLLPSQTGSRAIPLPATAAGESALVPLRFSVDLRSNSIIATGSEGDLRIVEALLLRLDQVTDQQRKSTVIQLKNSPAVDVASAINQYLLNQRQIEQAAPGEVNPYQELEREVVVVPEPVANKLILAATPRYFDEIKSLIDKLDEQPPQVMIQVLIAEVALNSINEFGIELGVQSSVLFDRSLLGDLVTTTNSTQTTTPAGVTTVTEQIIQAATNIPGFVFNNTGPLGNSGSAKSLNSSELVGGQAISNFAVGRGNDQAGFGGLVLSASSRNVNVLLRALNESRHVRILSRPQIRTLDNQPAFIQVGQRVPRIVGSTVNQNGQSNSIELENVGLILGVTPRVSPENMVVMEIDAEKSKLGDEQDGIPVAVSIDGTVIRSPRVDTTTAQATVSAANGETIILGGLIAENRAGVHRRVPIIKDIPVLKHLFKFDSEIWERSELLIILTPHVIRSSDDNERLKQVEFARMSWCECDVYRIHGDVNVSQVDLMQHIDSSGPPVIYPDLNPSGELQPVEITAPESLPYFEGMPDRDPSSPEMLPLDPLMLEDALESTP